MESHSIFENASSSQHLKELLLFINDLIVDPVQSSFIHKNKYKFQSLFSRFILASQSAGEELYDLSISNWPKCYIKTTDKPSSIQRQKTKSSRHERIFRFAVIPRSCPGIEEHNIYPFDIASEFLQSILTPLILASLSGGCSELEVNDSDPSKCPFSNTLIHLKDILTRNHKYLQKYRRHQRKVLLRLSTDGILEYRHIHYLPSTLVPNIRKLENLFYSTIQLDGGGLTNDNYFNAKEYSEINSIQATLTNIGLLREYTSQGLQQKRYTNHATLASHARLFSDWSKTICLQSENEVSPLPFRDAANILVKENPHNKFETILRRYLQFDASQQTIMEEYMFPHWPLSIYQSNNGCIGHNSSHIISKLAGSDTFKQITGIAQHEDRLNVAAQYVFDFRKHFVSSVFDSRSYLELNVDLRNQNINPLVHYILHGIEENREASRSSVKSQNGKVDFDNTMSTLIIVTHDMSRTGAPLICLELTKYLRNNFNLVVWSLKDGPLADDFLTNCCELYVGDHPKSSCLSIADHIFLEYTVHAALVNSAASVSAAREIDALGIPVVALIHEYASYFSQQVTESMKIAYKAIFPARHVLEDGIKYFNKYYAGLRASTAVRHQGICSTVFNPVNNICETIKHSESHRRFTDIIKNESQSGQPFIVLGSGYVQIRKGVDIFLQVASLIPKDNEVIFIWLGAGYQPDCDVNYSVWVRDYIERCGLQNRVYLLDEVVSIQEYLQQADVFLLSSRLDPFPNVLIEAACCGLYSIIFDNTSGFTEFILENPSVGCIVPYLDIAAAANAIVSRQNKSSSSQKKQRLDQGLIDKFSSDRYYEFILREINQTISKHAAVMRCAAEIAHHPLYNPSMLVSDADGNRSELESVFPSRLGSAGSQVDQCYRMLRYSILANAIIPCYESFSSYLSCMDRDIISNIFALWNSLEPFKSHVRLGILPSSRSRKVECKKNLVLAHFHAFYVEDIGRKIAQITAASSAFDKIVVTVPEGCEKAVSRALSGVNCGYEIVEVSNLGRNILPFIDTALRHSKDFDVVLHMHFKRSLHYDQHKAASWNDFLWDTLLGGREAEEIMSIVNCFDSDDSLGLLLPADATPLPNEPLPERYVDFCNIAGLKPASQFGLRYPVGCMFWMKLGRDIPFSWDMFNELTARCPVEPIPNDNTILHGFEHLLPCLIQSHNLTCKTLSVPGVYRPF